MARVGKRPWLEHLILHLKEEGIGPFVLAVLIDRKLPLPLTGKERGQGIWLGKDSVVGSGVLFVPPVLIGDRARIGDRSVIGPYTVIGDDCDIGQVVHCGESILLDRCNVHRGAQLNHCIFGFGIEIG